MTKDINKIQYGITPRLSGPELLAGLGCRATTEMTAWLHIVTLMSREEFLKLG